MADIVSGNEIGGKIDDEAAGSRPAPNDKSEARNPKEISSTKL
jgi:hypothetical protein